MWKFVGLVLILGQWILVTSETVQTEVNEDEVQRYARKAGDCCPCPDTSTRNTDLGQSASELIPMESCPCLRNADSETAPSIFSPVLSAVKPYSRSFEQKQDPKPLLEPEVDLASSVLETLREVTEEEYRDALARDAARSAIQSLDLEDSQANPVTIVVGPENREADDATPEASNNEGVTCIHPSFEDGYMRSSSDNINRAYDMNDAASNAYDTLHFPNRQELLPNINSPLIGPFGTRNLFNTNPLFALNRRHMLGYGRPLDIPNLLNLRDVELIPARKVTIARDRNHRPVIAGKAMPSSNKYATGFNDMPTNAQLMDNLQHRDCDWDTSHLNPDVTQDHNEHHTKILNKVPKGLESDKRINYGHDKARTTEDDLDKIEAIAETINRNNPQPSIYRNNENDASTGESRNNLNIWHKHETERQSLESDKHNHPSDSLNDPREAFPQYFDDRNTQLKDTNSLKNSASKTYEGIDNNNRDQNLRSNIHDIEETESIPRKAESEECNLNKDFETNSKAAEQNERLPNKLSMEDIQKMSNNLISNYENIKSRNKISNDNTARQNTDRFLTSPRTSYDKQEGALDEAENARSNQLLNNNDFSKAIETGDSARAATNRESCIIYDKAAGNENNEMYTAASESRNVHSGLEHYRNNLHSRLSNVDNDIYDGLERPIEDIDLDIFQYHPSARNSAGGKNADLPLFDVKSYKTHMPLPKSIDFQPVKLQKAFRRGNEILGATLTMKPHRNKLSFEPLDNTIRSASQPYGLRIPDINDIRNFVEKNTPNLLQLPFLSYRSNCEYDSPSSLRSDGSNHNLRTYPEQIFDNIHKNINGDRQTLEDAVFNPSDAIERIAYAHEDINDRLNALRIDLDDRLKKFHQSITGTPRAFSLAPHQQNRAPARTNIFQDPISNFNLPRLGSPSFKERPNTRTTNNMRTTNLREKPTTLNSRPRTLLNKGSDKTVKTPNRRLDTQLREASATKKPLSLHEKLKLSRESKGVVSYTTTKRPPLIQPPKLKPITGQRPPMPQTRLSQHETSRSSIPDRLGRWKEISREQKSSPSDVSIARTSSRNSPTSQDKSSPTQTPTGLATSRNALKKSLLPNLAENTFLSKVKEAVTKDLQRNQIANTNTDVVPAASESVRHAEPHEGMSFNCKMVCSKS